MTPVELVQRQLEAYNAHDLAAFVATYDEAVELFRVPFDRPEVVGKAALAERYATRVFNVPGHRAELLSRMVLGNKVVDHERVFGLSEIPREAVAVYEIEHELIRRVWFFRG